MDECELSNFSKGLSELFALLRLLLAILGLAIGPLAVLIVLVLLIIIIGDGHPMVGITVASPALRIRIGIWRCWEIITFDFRLLAWWRLLGRGIMRQLNRFLVVHAGTLGSRCLRSDGIHQHLHGTARTRMRTRWWPTAGHGAGIAGRRRVRGGPMEVRRQWRLVIRIDRFAQIMRRICQITVGINARYILANWSSILAQYQSRTDRAIVLQA